LPVRSVFIIAIVVVLTAAAAIVLREPAQNENVRVTAKGASGTPRIGGPFQLVDQHGRPFSDADLRGRPALIFFGYTQCPDVCPTTLLKLTEALDILGADGAAIQPVFITVDPLRDTPEVVADYVANFHPRLIGLTGTRTQIAARA
jgi:protein SCO1/2